MIDTLRLTAEGAMALLERGEVFGWQSSHAAYLDAIAERDGELHCYLRTSEEPSGDGIPIALKDVISTKGIETTAGSKILSGYTPVFDATVAARVKSAGLSLLGKTNTDEFAMGSSTENRPGAPQKPWDPTRIPGGSGGGTAAAVSAGLDAVARSVRTRVGRSGSRPRSAGRRSAADVRDASRATARRVRLEPRSDRAVRETVRDVALALSRSSPVAIRSTRRRRSPGRCSCRRVTRVARGPASAVPTSESSTRSIRRAGARASRRSRDCAGSAPRWGSATLPHHVSLRVAVRTTSSRPPRRRRTSRASTVFATVRVSTADVRRFGRRTRAEGFGPEPKRRIVLGTYVLSPGYYDAFYCEAQKVRTLLIREHREALEGFDAIVTPTSPTVAFPIGDKAADPLAMYACDLLTIPSCLAGLPGLSIPCGLSDGLPVGLQLIGRQFGENGLFRAGHALEQAIGFDTVPERLR